MEVHVLSYGAQRPNGQAALVDEYWTFADTSALFTGDGFVPAGKRLQLRSGERVTRLDEFTFQIAATGEVLRNARSVSTWTR